MILPQLLARLSLRQGHLMFLTSGGSGLSAMAVSYLTAWRLTDERLCDFVVVRRRCLPSGEAAVRGRACCSSSAEKTLSADRNERRLELEEFHGGLKSIRARSENAPTKILAAQRDRR